MRFKVVLVTNELSALDGRVEHSTYQNLNTVRMSYPYYNDRPFSPTIQISKTLETSMFQETI